MESGDIILTDTLSQVPARPEVPAVRLTSLSLRPVDPSGRMFSSIVVNVFPSSEMVHFDVAVTLPSRLVVDSQLFGPVALMDKVSPYFVTMTFPIERQGLDVVAEDELVLAAAGIFNLEGQAVELALVGIQFPFANEGIVGRERAGADEARSAQGSRMRE